MANGRIDENGLPLYAPGEYDYVRVVDRSTGASRNALAPEVTAAARELGERLDEVVSDAEADIAPVIAGLGYLPPVTYASGLDVDSTRFTVIRDGQVYAPAAPVPFTTGAWNAAQWRLIQGVAGADLASEYGAGMVGLASPQTGAATTVAEEMRIAGGPNEPTVLLRDAVVRAASSGRGGTVAFVFDDGYRSNYLYALPIFRRYGFAATLAMEMERIGTNYNGNPAYPVCTGSDMRELIAAGWEICNHPNLTLSDSEETMVAKARAEHDVLRAALTEGGLYPEFANYPVTAAVYRGGARNDTSDRAYRYLYDKVRSINGPIATRGNYLYVMGPGAERTTQMSAFAVDTTSNDLGVSKAFLESVAQTRSAAVIYAHDTPNGPGGATPHISASDLDELLRHCRDLGLAVVPLSRLYVGNAIYDTRFDAAVGSFNARSGDVSQFSASGTLHGADRCVLMTSNAFVGNTNTSYIPPEFVVDPFCRYRIRVRYRIDSDLGLAGGTANRNHGLNVSLFTNEGNTAGTPNSVHHANNEVLNTASDRLPYQETDGYGEHQYVLCTGWGSRAQLRVSLYNCTGTVRIGQIIVEKLDSLIDIPLSGKAAFNMTAHRSIRVPAIEGPATRRWEWELSVEAPVIEPEATYDYAFADSANVPTPSDGQTCYVLGIGAGDFAGQSGRLATRVAGAWQFSTLPVGHFFRVSNANGTANRWFRHRGYNTIEGALFEEFFSPVIAEVPIIKRQSAAEFRVYSSSGNRTDEFTWTARLRAA